MDHKREIINLESWQNIPLRDLVEFIRGVTFPKGSRLESYEKGTVAVATTKAAQLQGIEHDKLYFIPKSFVKRSEQFLLPNDIVVSIANSLDLVGRVTFTTQKDEGITWGAFLGVIRGNSKLISPYFLYAFLTTAKARQYFRKHARTTTNISNISSDTILSLSIPVPSLAEQKRIVKKIEELFGVIDEQVKRLETAQDALVSYRQSILSDCLKNATGISTTLGKIVKPRRERVSFDGTNGHIIFIGMDCIEPNALKPHKTDLLEKTKSTCFVFHKDDVLYGRMRSYLNKVFKAETNGAASAEFIVFPPTDTILSDYLKYLLHQQDFVSFATRNASGDRPRVKFEEDLAPFPFTLPSLSEQKAIVKKIETAFAFADKAQAAITDALEQTKQLKQSILKRAFEGKLVPQDPNDKPIDLTQLKKDKQK